jgi:tetratricopeptide (TPR) repeat protein
MWNPIANDIILLGSKKEMRLDTSLLVKKFSVPAINSDLGRIGINNLFTFLSCQSVSPRGFFKMTEEFPVNSEIHPLLEFMAPRSFYIGKPSGYVYGFDEKFDTLSGGIFLKEYAGLYPPDKKVMVSALHYLLKTKGNNRFACGLSKYLKELYPDDYEAAVLHLNSLANMPSANYDTGLLEKLFSLFPDSAAVIKDYNNWQISEKTNATTFLNLFSIKKEAAAFIKTTRPDSVSKMKVYLQLANGYLLNSEYKSAAEMCLRVEKILRADPGLIKSIDAEAYYYLGAVSGYYVNDYEKVIGYYIALINFNRNYHDRFSLRRLMSWQTRLAKRGR